MAKIYTGSADGKVSGDLVEIGPSSSFPVGKCKHCGKDVGPQADGETIVFCSYECYCLD